MTSDARTITESPTRGADLFRLAVLPTTPQPQRRAVTVTSQLGCTDSSKPLVAPAAAPAAALDAGGQRRETEGNRVYERG